MFREKARRPDVYKRVRGEGEGSQNGPEEKFETPAKHSFAESLADSQTVQTKGVVEVGRSGFDSGSGRLCFQSIARKRASGL